MKKMKKAIAVMLAFVMMFGLSLSAFAENSNSSNIQLIPSKTEPSLNDEFTVECKVITNPGICSMGLELNYDETVVEFLGFETAYNEDAEDYILVSDLISAYGTTVYNNEAGNISMATTKDKTRTGTLFTAKFRSIAIGNANISCTIKSANSVDNGDVTLTVDDSLTKDMIIYETFDVTYTNTKCTVAPAEGFTSPVKSGENYSFTVTLDDGYVAGNDFAVKANGNKLTATDGVYTIENITENQQITVEGIVEDIPTEGYVVSLTQDAKGKVPGETAQVNLVVNSKEYDKFNSFYAEMSYNPEYLTLQTTDNDCFEVEDNNGSVKIVAYGENKTLGNAFTLNFGVLNTKEDGIAVNLTQANVDVSENAVASDAPAAELGDTEVVFVAGQYSVNLKDWFKGDSTVVAGDDYTFTALDKNYNYTVTATMGGETVNVIDNQNGTFTIENVSGNLEITAERTAKTFSVTVNGAQENQVTFGNTATYASDYSFNVAAIEGHSTTVSMTIGGDAYTGFSANEGTYTILGKDITGNIIITVVNTASEYTWEFTGTGAGDAETTMESLSHGQDFVFTVTKAEGFDYSMTATMGENTATVKENDDGTYVIKNVKGNLVITINKAETFIPEIKTDEFVKVDEGAIAQVVTVKAENLPAEKTLTYNGEPMYWSEKYCAFVYLHMITDLVTADEENPVQVVDGERISIDYTGNVNGSTSIDVNDAQLVYDIYNAKYTNFETVSMFKFLCADVNGDMKIDVTDAAVIVNIITENK